VPLSSESYAFIRPQIKLSDKIKILKPFLQIAPAAKKLGSINLKVKSRSSTTLSEFSAFTRRRAHNENLKSHNGVVTLR